MKVTDLNEIRAAVAENLANFGGEVLDYLELGEATDAITMIYVTNDKMTGFGQDFVGSISIVSSPTRIAVIFLGHHSFYKHDGSICNYDDLDDDVNEIRIVLNTALARWAEQNE